MADRVAQGACQHSLLHTPGVRTDRPFYPALAPFSSVKLILHTQTDCKRYRTASTALKQTDVLSNGSVRIGSLVDRIWH